MDNVVRRFTQWRTDELARAAFARAPLPLAASPVWQLNAQALERSDHHFFSIIGTQHQTTSRVVTMPMLYQRDIALSACAIRHSANGPEWWLQFKIEPGNTHGAQLAPTVDATQSNLELHVGETMSLRSVIAAPSIVAKGLWSDSGSQCLGSRAEYRSVIIETNCDLPEPPTHQWVTRDELRTLLAEDYLMSTALRSVVATGPWDLLASSPDGPFRGPLRASYHAADRGIGHALAILKELHATRAFPTIIPLSEVIDLECAPDSAIPLSHPALDVHHVAVNVASGEIPRWDQPLVAARGVRRTVLVLSPDPSGVIRARCYAALDPGAIHSTEWTATIVEQSKASPTALPPHEVLVSTWSSDMGARFDNCQQQIIVALADSPLPAGPPGVPSVDLTLGALERLVHTPGAVTSDLHAAVSALLHLA